MYAFWALLILLIFTVASMPAYPYSRGWGYYPSGIFLLMAMLWLLLLYLGLFTFQYPWAPPPSPQPAIQ